MVHRILQVVGELNPTGIDCFVMSIYRELVSSGMQFDFVVHGYGPSAFAEEVLSHGGRIHRIERKSHNYFKSQYQLMQIFNKGDYNIVHAHQDSMSGLTLKQAAKHGIKHRIAHAHTTNYPRGIRKRVYRKAKQLVNEFATIKLACSQRAGEWLYGSDDFSIIKNCVDSEHFYYSEKKRQAVRKELGVSREKILLHVGRFAPVKNHTFLIRLINELVCSGHPDWKLVLVGSGPLVHGMKQMVSSNNLNSNVLFLGERDDIADVLSAADCFLLPSLFEGIPISLLEAQASGINAIVSNNVDTEAILVDNVHALPIESVELWIDCLLNMDFNQDRKAINNKIAKQADCKVSARDLAEIYTKLEES